MILIGWNPYYQVITKLSSTKWRYSDFITYVITHNERNSIEQIRFTNENSVDLSGKYQHIIIERMNYNIEEV